MARIRKNPAAPKWNEERERWEFQVQKHAKRKMFTSKKEGQAGANACKRRTNKWLASGQVDRVKSLRDINEEYLQDIVEHKGDNSNCRRSQGLLTPSSWKQET